MNHIKLKEISCNLCSENQTKNLFLKEGKIHKIKFNILKCCKCGLVYVNPRLDENEIKKLYNNEYLKGQGFDSSIDYLSSIKTENKKKETQKTVEMIMLLKREGKLLDVGCGLGDLVFAASKSGFDAKGIDLIKQDKKKKLICADFMKYKFGKDKFDVITAFEVVEHIENPTKFFKKVKFLLEKNGIFVYSTGNIDSLSAKILGKKWYYIMPEGHIYYFSDKTIEKFFKKANLKTLDIKGLLSKNDLKKYEKLSNEILFCRFIEFIGNKNKSSSIFIFFLSRIKFIGKFLSFFLGKDKMKYAYNPE